MVTVNSLSGGRTSSYMAVHYPTDVNIFACVCIDDPKCSPKDHGIVRYVSDKLNYDFIASAEHEKTLKVLMQLEQLIGKEIVWVRGKSFDQIIDEAGCLPNWARRFCTTGMKILPIFEYCYFRYGVIKEQIGYRYDEHWRAFEIEETEIDTNQMSIFDSFVDKKIERKKVWKIKSHISDYPISCNYFGKNRNNLETILWAEKSFPLIYDRVVHSIIKKYWLSKPEFDFPEDSNCRGCHHKSKWRIKQNYIETPEHLNWFSRQEQKKKFNTWHDDRVSYEQIFAMDFNDLIRMEGGSCSTGYCTD